MSQQDRVDEAIKVLGIVPADTIPDGYQTLHDAVEQAGRALFPDLWTGAERRLTLKKPNRLGKKIFRNDAEIELVEAETSEVSKMISAGVTGGRPPMGIVREKSMGRAFPQSRPNHSWSH